MEITEGEKKVSSKKCRKFFLRVAIEISVVILSSSRFIGCFSHHALLMWSLRAGLVIFALGASVSSDTSLGYNDEVEMALIPWQVTEEDQEVNATEGVCVDPDAPRWLQLSPSETANLTGAVVQNVGLLG